MHGAACRAQAEFDHLARPFDHRDDALTRRERF
jgi:hypothetical protein